VAIWLGWISVLPSKPRRRPSAHSAASRSGAYPEQAALGAIRLDGQMVERLHLAEAERILVLARH
jgi:citrate lyase beta subunit